MIPATINAGMTSQAMENRYSRNACHARDQFPPVAASTHKGTSDTSAAIDNSSNSRGCM